MKNQLFYLLNLLCSVKRRPSSDSLCYKKKRNQNRLKSTCLSQRQEKSEVPDIIEGVPVCSGEYKSHFNKNVEDKLYPGRVEFDDNCSSRKDSRWVRQHSSPQMIIKL